MLVPTVPLGVLVTSYLATPNTLKGSTTLISHLMSSFLSLSLRNSSLRISMVTGADARLATMPMMQLCTQSQSFLQISKYFLFVHPTSIVYLHFLPSAACDLCGAAPLLTARPGPCGCCCGLSPRLPALFSLDPCDRVELVGGRPVLFRGCLSFDWAELELTLDEFLSSLMDTAFLAATFLSTSSLDSLVAEDAGEWPRL